MFFGLPYETHTRYLEFLIGRPYITDQLYRRFYRLLINMGQSSNRKVSFLTKFLLNDSSSLMCRNVQCIARRYKFNYYERLQKQYTICSFIMPSSNEDERIAMQILELCDQKIDFILDNDEYNSILYYLCCDWLTKIILNFKSILLWSFLCQFYCMKLSKFFNF